MKTLLNKSIIAALSFLFVMAMSPANAAENPFGMSQASTDMHVASNHEGKCGEGKCGDSMKEGKMKEGKCGDSMKEGKMKEGKCGDSMKEGKCGSSRDSEMKSKCGSE